MTFDNVPIITFNDSVGNIFPVRDRRDLDVWQLAQTIQVLKGMQIDEVISRREFFGAGSEDLSYAVVDLNAVPLAEQDFDLTQLKKIDIPVIEGQ